MWIEEELVAHPERLAARAVVDGEFGLPASRDGILERDDAGDLVEPSTVHLSNHLVQVVQFVDGIHLVREFHAGVVEHPPRLILDVDHEGVDDGLVRHLKQFLPHSGLPEDVERYVECPDDLRRRLDLDDEGLSVHTYSVSCHPGLLTKTVPAKALTYLEATRTDLL